MRTTDIEPAIARSELSSSGLPRSETLLLRFGLLFLLLLLLVGGGALLAVQFLVEAPLADDIEHHEQSLTASLAVETNTFASDAEQVAVTLATLAANQHFAAALNTPMQALLQNLPNAERYAAIGLWPEPNVTAAGVERASLYWVRDASGRLQQRNDYNDPKTAPYFHEAWYTPARFGPDNRCYWTPAQQEPLSRRSVVTCTAPVRLNGLFAGTATVSLDLAQLSDALKRAASQMPGYAVLLDRDGRSLALGGSIGLLSDALAPGRDIAELAQKLSAYNPLALAIHARLDALHQAALHSASYDPAKISQVQDNTRGNVRSDAENAVFWIWTHDKAAPQPETLKLEQDPALNASSLSTIVGVGSTGWTLIRSTSRHEGLAGIGYLTRQTVVVCIGLVAIALLIAFAALRGTVVKPLQRIAQMLMASDREPGSIGPTLDHKARNEIGFIALWQNERVRRLRDITDRATATNSQLVVEAGERARVQDQLARTQELRRALIETVDRAVLVCDERGGIAELNPVAERLLGQKLGSVKGRPIEEIFIAQIDGDSEAPLANTIMDSMQRGTPLEFSDGVLLRSLGGLTEISVSLTPLIGRGARAEGCLVLFHEAMRGTRPAAETGYDTELDPQTGLGRRGSCERRLRALLESIDSLGGEATLAVVDVDGIQRIVDEAGPQAGNEVLAALTELLSARAGTSDCVFRLPGDQFAVVLEHFGLAAAREFSEQLCTGIDALSFLGEERPMKVVPNVGLAPIDPSNNSPAEIMRRAAKAATAARQSEAHGVRVFEPSLDRDTAHTDELWIGRIRRGLDEELFHLSTQWISTSESLRSEGLAYELLLALEDEEGFWSPPAAFLPVVERNGLSSEVDQWVVERVLRMLDADTRTLGDLAFVNINVAAGTIADSGFLDYLSDAFNRYPGVSPSKLCFDLPLGAASDPATDTPAFCSTVRLMGARTCLSPGTLRKASDLDVLRRLPVDILAFDASLFPRLAEDEAERLMADSLLRIGKLLKRRVLITRIETSQQENAWHKLGADYFQGYAVARPTPVMFQAPTR